MIIPATKFTELRIAATEAAEKSYSPYSKFRVGAAALWHLDGTFYISRGTNIENASFGLTICAERAAIFKGVSDGFRTLLAIAVVCPGVTAASPVEHSMPCGACRQVMSEFGDTEMKVFVGNRLSRPLRELLPMAFKL